MIRLWWGIVSKMPLCVRQSIIDFEMHRAIQQACKTRKKNEARLDLIASKPNYYV